MCSEVNLALETLKIAPTAFVGAVAVYIAWRQYKVGAEQREIARAKLNLDLFERRLAVFDATWEAASRLSTNEPSYPPVTFTNLYPQAAFLFGPEVEAYMKMLAAKLTQLAIIADLTSKNGGVVPADRTAERGNLEQWILVAAVDEIRAIFSPYLKFSQWR